MYTSNFCIIHNTITLMQHDKFVIQFMEIRLIIFKPPAAENWKTKYISLFSDMIYSQKAFGRYLYLLVSTYLHLSAYRCEFYGF